MELSLTGKQALICGSTQGIGLAIAKELALLGADCTLFARNEAALQEALTLLSVSPGQQHRYRVADFQYPDRVKEIIEAHAKEFPVHILINNTGGPPPGPITEATVEQFINAFQQHIICNQVLAQAALPSMKAAKFGRIINIISTSVRIPLKNLGVSNTIRGAVASWAKTLSNEVAQYGITVNNILPGFTKTNRLNSLIAQIAAKAQTSVDVVSNEMEDDVPAKRFGEAHEIAAVAAFLASPAASYVNGVSIPVDGGRTGSI
jgi:3-oxoacyl-[acyl-carrier protein] reductase